MSRVLRHNVHVTLEDNSVVILPAGASVPKEYAEFVTNPKAYVDVELAGDGEQAAGGEGLYAGESVPNLKAELKKRELPQTGNKAELIERLLADDADSEGDDEPAEAEENQE